VSKEFGDLSKIAVICKRMSVFKRAIKKSGPF